LNRASVGLSTAREHFPRTTTNTRAGTVRCACGAPRRGICGATPRFILTMASPRAGGSEAALKEELRAADGEAPVMPVGHDAGADAGPGSANVVIKHSVRITGGVSLTAAIRGIEPASPHMLFVRKVCAVSGQPDTVVSPTEVIDADAMYFVVHASDAWPTPPIHATILTGAAGAPAGQVLAETSCRMQPQLVSASALGARATVNDVVCESGRQPLVRAVCVAGE